MNNNSNTSMHAYCASSSCLFSTASQYIIISILFLLFIASLVGNVLILVLLYKDRQLRARSSPSHISLAIADLLATIFWLPFLVSDLYIAEKWVFGYASCKVVSFFQTIAIPSSTLNLCIVTSECFAAVWFPIFLKVLPRKRTILITSCAVVWFVAFVGSLFYVPFKNIKTYDGVDYCVETFPDETTKNIYIYTNSSLFGFGPLIVITVLNILCIYRLCQTNSLVSSRRHSLSGTYTRSAIKKIITISLIFVICRGPLHILELAMMSDDVQYHLAYKRPKVSISLFTSCIGLYFFSAATHPVLFGLMSVYYREAFIRNCPCYTIPRRRRTSSTKTAQTSKVLETML
ncbi:QRFP-like peptide receptor [Exaiptasia diaphana]|uniref:G-protein coupled receptors family 1 profile domain-containing protein n=1 Tax=Exaiptasia diaphana TaxID=2652724 RepID=A0A913XLJ1_EXADI|nr:QRFP-like peptide receptor [Exaiptasia diaphana]